MNKSFYVIKCEKGYLKVTYTKDWEQQTKYVSNKSEASTFFKRSANLIIKKHNLQGIELESIIIDKRKSTVIEVDGKLIAIDE